MPVKYWLLRQIGTLAFAAVCLMPTLGIAEV